MLTLLAIAVAVFVVIVILHAWRLSAGLSDVQWMFHTKVVGVSHRNRDRRSRQKIIRESCSVGDRLTLIPEPENKFDENAIGVWTRDGQQVGYLSSEIARVAAEKGETADLVAQITEVTGGDSGQYFGVNIRIGKRKAAHTSN